VLWLPMMRLDQDR